MDAVSQSLSVFPDHIVENSKAFFISSTHIPEIEFVVSRLSVLKWIALFDLFPASQAENENPLLIACSAIYLWYSTLLVFIGPPYNP